MTATKIPDTTPDPVEADTADEHGTRRGALTKLLGGLGAAALIGCDRVASGSRPPEINVIAEALTGGGTVKIADTVANLRTITGGDTLWVAVLEGISAAGDGGGGVFYWSAASIADDGWSVLNSGAGTSAGWRRVNGG